MSLTDKEKAHYHSMNADERKVEIKSQLLAAYRAVNDGSIDRPTANMALTVIEELTVADDPKAAVVPPKPGFFTPATPVTPTPATPVAH
jgi:hypothetical protein